MRNVIAFCLLLFACSIHAATSSRISVEVTVTNPPVSGATFALNGAVRMWTNANSSTTILTNLVDVNGSATNLFNDYASFPVGSGITHAMTATNKVKFTGPLGLVFTGTATGNWATITLTTQSGPTTYTALWPMENMVGETNRTNQGTALVHGLGIYSTEAFPTNSTALSNHVTKGPAPLQVIQSPIQAWSLSGTNVGLTNGYIVNATILSAILSNATLGGNTTVTGASLNLVGSGANNFISLTATSTTAAVGSIISMQRENGIATAVDAGDVLGIIGFSGYGATALKVGARIRAIPMETFTDSTSGSIMLFETTPPGSTTPVGRLHVGETGTITVSNVFYAASITNATIRGTNTINAITVYTPTENSSLANGYNSAVAINATYVRFSGPSAAYTNVGFSAANKMDGKFAICQFDNPGLSFTLLHDSGLDAGDTNRIYTGTGALLNSTNNPAFAELIYDNAVTRWRVISFR